MSRHKIFRQQMHLQFLGQPEAGAGPELLAAFTRDKLMPAMEKVLQQHDRPGTTLRIPSITLDAGTLTGPHWQELLTTTLCRQLDLYLRECLLAPVPEHRKEPEATPWVSTDEQATLQQTLLHYLRTGMLPWYAQGTRPPLSEAAISLAEQPNFYQSTLLVEIISQPLMMKRWLLLLPFSTALQAMLGPRLSYPLRTMLEDSAAKGFGEKTAPEARRRLLLTLLLYQLHEVPVAAWQQQCTWYGVPAFFGAAPAAQFMSPPFTQKDPLQALQQIIEWLKAANSNSSSTTHYTKAEANAESTDAIVAETEDRKEAESEDRPTKHKVTETKELLEQLVDSVASEKVPEGSSWPADHAGLVLLHPFIPGFFQALRLTNEAHAWTDAMAQQTAVNRLFALANPESPVADYDLLLAKLLCGWPEALPIAPLPPPEPWELDEMNSLLEAVIQHWQRLGNTSPDGLRQAFLQRTGTLTKQSAGWELTVASGSYDVLLSTLPWGISMIKTPWMKDWLRVNWQ